jgi:TrmH family RNA methyltransferase
MLIGNEAKGLSIRLKSLADKMIKIPMRGEVDSLNVACAASIIMYEVYESNKD